MNYLSWNAKNELYKYQYYSSILLRLKLGVGSYRACVWA